jgi:hypothetical protein
MRAGWWRRFWRTSGEAQRVDSDHYPNKADSRYFSRLAYRVKGEAEPLGGKVRTSPELLAAERIDGNFGNRRDASSSNRNRNTMYCAHLGPKTAIDRCNFYWTTGTTCLSFPSQRSRRALLTPRSLRLSWDREYIANVLRPSGRSI